MDSNSAAISRLWAEYKSSGSREARDGLIRHYVPLVKYIAERVSVGLPQYEQADLVSYGIFGLIDAIVKFDPDRKITFETDAIARIKGAIIDEVRSIGWVPRSVHGEARERAYAEFENQILRMPSDAEIAADLGISDSEL